MGTTTYSSTSNQASREAFGEIMEGVVLLNSLIPSGVPFELRMKLIEEGLTHALKERERFP